MSKLVPVCQVSCGSGSWSEKGIAGKGQQGCYGVQAEQGKKGTYIKFSGTACSAEYHQNTEYLTEGQWDTSEGSRVSVRKGCTCNWVDSEGLEEASIHGGEGSTSLAWGSRAHERRSKYCGEGN